MTFLLVASLSVAAVLSVHEPGALVAPPTVLSTVRTWAGPGSYANSTGSAVNWTNLTNGPAPSPRQLAAVTYDAHDGYMLLFGGGIHRDGVSYNDTWKYEAGKWTELFPSPSPQGRLGAGMVYDSRDGYVLLFGGYNESSATFLDDTWEYANGKWTEVLPTLAPSARWLFGMSYDTTLGEVVLFGGGDFGTLGGTWTFTGGHWTDVTGSVHSPPWRSDAGMAYDPLDGYSVLYGGNGNSSLLSDTWAFADGNWTNLTHVVRPPANSDFGLAFDSEVGSVVLATSVSSSTWSFGSGSWTNISARFTSNYPARSHFSFADDPKDGYTLLYGGGGTYFLRDTWALDYMNVSASIANATGESIDPVSVGSTVHGGVTPLTAGWNFSGGEVVTGQNGTTNLSTPGKFTVSYTVRDSHGVTVNFPLLPIDVLAHVEVTARATPGEGTVPVEVNLTAVGALGVSPYTFFWTYIDGTTATGPSVSHWYNSSGSYSTEVKVTDADGRTANASVTITAGSGGSSGQNQSKSAASDDLLLDALVGAAVAAAVVGTGVFLLRRRRGPDRP
jgi:hypothetical protein